MPTSFLFNLRWYNSAIILYIRRNNLHNIKVFSLYYIKYMIK